jgi:hypothetical protein
MNRQGDTNAAAPTALIPSPESRSSNLDAIAGRPTGGRIDGAASMEEGGRFNSRDDGSTLCDVATSYC